MRVWILVLLLVTGCAQQIGATGAAVTTEARALKDAEARALIDSTCLMGIGAWNRLTNPNEQIGTMLMCGGQTNDLLEMRAGSIKLEPNR